ncbi:MAG: hypothetical protein BRD44_06075 [Bacteroidetes bacterium QS_7_67_15]|nr:MAG: hypothetical protein BRD44_06075 [Bacteroidetes bacterium QS_7_67_15]
MARTSRNKRRASGEDAPSRWQRLSPVAQHAVCVGLLLLVSLTFFAPMHFSDGQLIGGDTVNWRATNDTPIEYYEETGRQPLWNPSAFGGMPTYLGFYKDQVPQIDDLPRLLRKVVWPTSHFIFLLIGTYGLVFFLTRNKGAGLLAAVGYGLTTYLPIILTAGHNTKFIALAFAPWMAWAFAWALRRPRLLSSLAFAVALAANLRAGHVQITYYLTFLLGLWWIVEAVGAVRHRQQDGRLASFGKATGWLALGSVLGVMMVAQPYLVQAEYKAYSIRGDATSEGGSDGLESDYAMRWSQGPGELLTLAVAGAYGGSSTEGTYWGPKPFTEGPHYVGGVVLFLALLAVWKRRERNVVKAFGLGALLMTFFALGRHFRLLNDAMFAYFPLFDAFRAPETWMSMVAFALAVLAGLGADYAFRRGANRTKDTERSRAVYYSAGAVAALVALLYVGGDVFFDFEKEGERQRIRRQVQQQMRARVSQQPNLSMRSPRVQRAVDQNVSRYMERVQPERRDALTGDALRTLLFLALALGALALYRRETIPYWGAAAALVVLVGADLGGVGRRHINEDALTEAPDAEAQIQRYGADEFLLEKRRQAGGRGHFRVADFSGGNPMNTARTSYFHESIGGYHGAKLQRYQDFIDHVFRKPQGGVSENALDLMNTRYIISQRRLPGTRVVYQGQQAQGRRQRRAPNVLKNPDALPRAFFVGQTEVVESPEATWKRLRSDRFNPRRTALLPAPIEGFETTPIDSASTTSVTLEEYGPREIAWQVQTDAPRLFVASETYYPAGWNAYLDGERVDIHRVDYLLRGVAVPEGSHRLVMRFEPVRHRAGLWISGVSTAGVYGLVLVLVGRAAWRRRERWTDEASSSDDEEETDGGGE